MKIPQWDPELYRGKYSVMEFGATRDLENFLVLIT